MSRYVLKNDHPDFGYEFEVGDVFDAEGELLPDDAVEVFVESSDPDVLQVTPSDTGNNGNVHVGRSGVAALTFSAKAKNGNGEVLASHTDDFTITTGDPKSVSEISVKLDGVEPEPEASETGGTTGTETGGTSESESESEGDAEPAEESSESTAAEETASSGSEESASDDKVGGGI